MLNDVGHRSVETGSSQKEGTQFYKENNFVLLCCSVGSMFPGLGHLLLLRLNPISLLALGQSLSVLTAKIFIDLE